MSCPQENLILRFVSGELPEAAASEFRRHLNACPVCEAVLSEMREAWDSLAALPADMSGVDLSARLMQTVRDSTTHADSAVRRSDRGWRESLRAAAVLLIAVGLGAAGGRLITGAKPASSPREPVEITSEEAAYDLGIADLAEGFVTGLPEGLLTDDASDEGGES